MNNTQDRALMKEALEKQIDDYAYAEAKYQLESMYGTSKAYTAEKLREAQQAREELLATITARLEQPDVQPVARVSEVHMSRYTLEWTNGPLPEGTELFAHPTPVTAGDVRKPMTDEQWQAIADITQWIITRDMKEEISQVLGITTKEQQ